MKIMMLILAVLLCGVCFSGVKAAKFAHEQSNLVNEVQSLKKQWLNQLLKKLQKRK